jgi:hypothetical protein
MWSRSLLKSVIESLTRSCQVEPELNLVSMPHEILDRIISLAIPETVCVTATYSPEFWKHCRPLEWDSDWVLGLLAVSKRLRQVARRSLALRVEAVIRVHILWSPVSYPLNSARLEARTRDYLTEMLTRDEEQTLASP